MVICSANVPAGTVTDAQLASVVAVLIVGYAPVPGVTAQASAARRGGAAMTSAVPASSRLLRAAPTRKRRAFRTIAPLISPRIFVLLLYDARDASARAATALP